jgi:hypothetical protein
MMVLMKIDIVFEQIEKISLKIFESFSFKILIAFSSLNLVGFPNFNFSKLVSNLFFFFKSNNFATSLIKHATLLLVKKPTKKHSSNLQNPFPKTG